MTQEEKRLLFKDLCARLPYGVKVSCRPYFGLDPRTLYSLSSFGRNDYYAIEGDPIAHPIREMDSSGFGILLNIKPYLRPMSSMTKEEEDDLRVLKNRLVECNEDDDEKFYGIIDDIHNFYYSRHIDCSSLIDRGLALEAKEGMYNV